MRRRVLASVGGKQLPYLRRVAYLESHGTEWIDTGVNAETGLTAKVGVRFTSYQSNANFLSAANTSSLENKAMYMLAQYPESKWFLRYGNSYMSVSNKFDLSYHDVVSSATEDKQVLAIDGEDVISFDNATRQNVGLNLYAFAINRNGVPSFQVKARLYYLELYMGETLIADSIPVLDLSGRPAMYDEVSGQLFYNQGTGEFTWGELDASSNAPSQLGGGV